MGRPQSIEDQGPTVQEVAQRAPSGSQTLYRGLDVLDAVLEGTVGLADLAGRLQLTRSTTHRLAAALVERRYLTFVPREGYSLGPKLLELGYQAAQQMDVPRLARPHLERLSAISEDTVHLGILEGDSALYLDKIPGQRRISIISRIGERQPLTTTGLGKALLLDHDESAWRRQFAADAGHRLHDEALEHWLRRMRTYAAQGYAFDLEENEDRIRCVAAPIRGAGGRIVAAISVSSAAQYMDQARMDQLVSEVQRTASDISLDLGAGSASVPARFGKARAERAKEPV
jgi:DNA-binding IclR family transcriptional regulator